MKILFCNYEYPPLGGGGGVVNAWLAEALAVKHDVTVLTSSAYGLSADEMINGVRIVRVPVYFRNKLQAANIASLAAFVVNGIQRGKQLIQEQQFDVINTHFVIPTGPVGHILAKRAGIPNVLSVHGGDLYDPSKYLSPHRHFFLRLPARYLLKKANAVVGQSKNTNENVHTYYGEDVQCKLIPLGIPRVQFESSARERYQLANEDFVLITVGRLVSRKGVEQLIELMRRMADTRIKLVVVGGGPKKEELEELSVQRGVRERVLFTGQASDEDKVNLLACADLYVSTSQHEGFGLVFLEGMAAGLPVVCYDHGGQTDFVANDENGYLVELNDLTTFESRIRQLLSDRQLKERLSAGSLSTVEEYFIDSCAAKYESLFEASIRS